MKALIICCGLLLFISCNKHGEQNHDEAKIEVLDILPLENSEGFYVISMYEAPYNFKIMASLYGESGLVRSDSIGSHFDKFKRANDSLLIIGREHDSVIIAYNFFTKQKKELLKWYALKAVSNNGKYFIARQMKDPQATFLYKLTKEGIDKGIQLKDTMFSTIPFNSSKFIAEILGKPNWELPAFTIIDSNGRSLDSLFITTGYEFRTGNIFPGRNPQELFIIAGSHVNEHNLQYELYSFKMNYLWWVLPQLAPLIPDINTTDVGGAVRDSFIIFRGVTAKDYEKYQVEYLNSKKEYLKEHPTFSSSSYVDPRGKYVGSMMMRNLLTGETRVLNPDILKICLSTSGKTAAVITGNYENQKAMVQSRYKLWANGKPLSAEP